MSKTIDWWGCYDDGWRDLIVPDAFQHPAKYRPGLIKRIYEFGFERGWWEKGSLIGDCFGGVACGGIMAAYQGLAWFGVELESRFCELAQRNIELHRKRWQAAGDPIPEIIQGDSREFARLVGCHSIVTSPPFADSDTKPTKLGSGKATRADGDGAGRNKGDYHYGSTPGQIGNLKAGELDAVVTNPPITDSREGTTAGNIGDLRAIVTSPPYAGSSPESNSKSVDLEKQYETYRESGGGASFKAFCATQEKHSAGYGSTEGNIGNLKACVTSPPWENQEPSHAQGNEPSKDKLRAATGRAQRFMDAEYGDSDGQLGNTSGGSYWEAMKIVYEQCGLAIRPGGMLVVVVKNFVSKGKRVPLCDQTLALLESLGFTLVERIRAWVTETTVHPGLFEEVEETKSKKSFFRRLAENRGSPSIDWEEVICVRTP